MNTPICPPDLVTNLKRLKNEIFADLNCIQIGKITKFDKTTQLAEVEIQCKCRISETQIIDYPPLPDVPVFFLQGGGAFLEMPVQANDYCLILFNDRDIDVFVATGNVTEPNSRRKHNLSDAIALVGLNPTSSVLSLENDKVRINAGNYPIVFETIAGKIEISINGNITFNEGTESYIKGDTIKTMLLTLCSSIAAISPSNPVTAGQFAALQAAFSAFNAQLGTILSTQIKGK